MSMGAVRKAWRGWVSTETLVRVEGEFHVGVVPVWVADESGAETRGVDRCGHEHLSRSAAQLCARRTARRLRAGGFQEGRT